VQSNDRILITGATGFIGGRLLEILAPLKNRIRIVTSNFTHCARVSRYDVELVRADLLDHEAIASAAKDCDIIFHCAYRFGGTLEEKCAANVDGTRALAKAALQHGARRFVHLSSVATYGLCDDGPITENRKPCRIEDTYSRVKRAIDEMLLDLHAQHGLPVIILQPTIVYGPYGQTWTIKLLDQLRSSLVALPKEGAGICNAVYIDDVVNAAIGSANCTGVLGEKFLISGPAPITWRMFYNAYEQMLGKNSLVFLNDAEIRNMEHSLEETANNGKELSIPDEATLSLYSSSAIVRTDKARRQLGFEPAFDLDRGMALTREWAVWANLLNQALTFDCGQKIQ
jgi:nucleoside-diphosphate-sugar epimerase